jgi:adenine phosphoribosyltransferase
MNISELTQSLQDAPIVKKGNYYYVIHPITDGVPSITPKLLREVSYNISKELKNYTPFDRIVTIEAMGIPLATLASIHFNIPFTIIRKRSYGLPDEVSVQQITGYSKSNLFINGIKKGDKIVIVDDVLSTGGTLRAVITAFQKIQATIKTIIIAIDKGNCTREISSEFNIPIHCLTQINVNEGKLNILQSGTTKR